MFFAGRFTLSQSSPPVRYATPKVTKYQRCNFIIQIHKYTIKFDAICINLLFECVKIVEFNFNSHVFLVMYQEKRFLNQDVCFLNQEERQQFLISFVSERDWRREHRLEFKMASNRFYILLYFKWKWIFRRFVLLVAAVRDCVNDNTDGGHAEFLARRLARGQLWILRNTLLFCSALIIKVTV